MVDVSDDVAVAGEGDGGVFVDDWGHVCPTVGGFIDGYHVVSSGEDEGVDAWFRVYCHPLCFCPVFVCAPGEESSDEVEHTPPFFVWGVSEYGPPPL